jgi:uncharacterized HhH-GPD family protein
MFAGGSNVAIERADSIFWSDENPQTQMPITSVREIDSSFAFLIAILFNQGQQARKSFQVPALLRERLGSINPWDLYELPPKSLLEAIARYPALHRFPRVMSRYLESLLRIVIINYEGDARRIWEPAVPAHTLLSRLRKFPGIGEHKAKLALFLLTVDYNVIVFDDGTKVDIRACQGLARLLEPIHEARLQPQT